MRTGILLMVILGVAVTAMAQDLGTTKELPVKNTPTVTYEPPALPRQGGDTIENATLISGLPFTDTGTTDGYVDDYDEICPYYAPGSPDIVYGFTPANDIRINVDLCGSSYDTKTYIYDVDLTLIACNDDAYFDDDCGVYVSEIEEAHLTGGTRYFFVIDGYGGDFGDYILVVTEVEPCFVYCPEDAVPEGEPSFHDGYDDAHNGGCNSPGFDYPFQEIDWTNDEDGVPPYDGTAWMCGKSGWFLNSEGLNSRDTDWFRVFARETGIMEFTVESEFPCLSVVISHRCCSCPAVDGLAFPDCGAPATLTYPVDVGQEIWLVVLPATFTGPVTEFTYFMTVSNNTFDTVPAEGMSWGGVKSLYR